MFYKIKDTSIQIYVVLLVILVLPRVFVMFLQDTMMENMIIYFKWKGRTYSLMMKTSGGGNNSLYVRR